MAAPDLLQLVKDYRAAGGTMINLTFLADGGVQVNIQNADKHSWCCGMGESVEAAVEKAFGSPKHRESIIRPPMVDRSLDDPDDDLYADLI